MNITRTTTMFHLWDNSICALLLQWIHCMTLFPFDGSRGCPWARNIRKKGLESSLFTKVATSQQLCQHSLLNKKNCYDLKIIIPPHVQWSQFALNQRAWRQLTKRGKTCQYFECNFFSWCAGYEKKFQNALKWHVQRIGK